MTWEDQNKLIKWQISQINFNKLSDWEENFLISIEAQSDAGKILSTKQLEVLERLYIEKDKSG